MKIRLPSRKVFKLKKESKKITSAYLNRSAVMLRPKQPMLDWLNTLPELMPDMTLEDIRKDSTVYLLPERAFDGDVLKMVYENWDKYFSMQLTAWWTEDGQWPANRSMAMFKEWFDVEVCSELFDMADGPIEKKKEETEFIKDMRKYAAVAKLKTRTAINNGMKRWRKFRAKG